MAQDPNNPLAGISYGPFTDAIAAPPQQQQQKPFTYSPGKGGAIVSFANSFLTGLQQGRRTAYERSEKTKQEHANTFNSAYQQIMNDPEVPKQYKDQARQLWTQTTVPQVQRGVDDLEKAAKKDGKPVSPIVHLIKMISSGASAVAGPTSNKEHQDYVKPLADMATLMRQAYDPKNRIDPNALGVKAAQGLTSAISDIENRPGVPNANAGQPAAAQVPGLSLPPAPELRQEANQKNIAQNPQAQTALAPMIQQGINPYEHPATAPILNSLPKTGAAKPIGATYVLQGTDGKNHRFQNYQGTDGNISKIDLGVAGETANAGRPVQGSQLTFLDSAVKEAKGGKKFLDIEGHPIDVEKLKRENPTMALQPWSTSKGIFYEPVDPRYVQIHAGNEVYAAPSQQLGQPQNYVDIGQQNAGSSGTTQQLAIDPSSGELTKNTLTRTTTPNTPGAKGAIPGQPDTSPSRRTAPPPTVQGQPAVAAPSGATPAPQTTSTASAAPRGAASGINGLPLSLYNQATTRVTPVTEFVTQTFGDPTQPDQKGLVSFADVSDNADSREKLGKAFRLTFDALDHAQSASGGFSEWIKNMAGVTDAIASSRASVLSGAVGELSPREQEAYNATMNAFGTAVGLRSLSRASASQGSVRRIESELPLIGINTNSSADFYDKSARLAEQAYNGTRGIPKTMFRPGELEYITNLPKQMAEKKKAASQSGSSLPKYTNKAGVTFEIGKPAPAPDGKWYKVKAIDSKGNITSEDTPVSPPK